MTRLALALALLTVSSDLSAQDRNRTPPRCRDVCRWVDITRCDSRGMNCVITREWVCPNWCRE